MALFLFLNTEINKKQSTWKAALYKTYKNVTRHQMRSRAGGKRWTMGKPQTMLSTPNTQLGKMSTQLK